MIYDPVFVLPDQDRGADKIRIPHQSLKPGDQCPACLKGKVYEMKGPAVVIRIVGQAPRNLCGKVFTAKLPENCGSKKYEETA